MKFKPLLDRWKKAAAPLKSAKEYAVRLPLDDAAKLQALAELFPGYSIEDIVTDLLRVGLDEIAAAMPYVKGSKVISSDDHGDPVYEDIGLTPAIHRTHPQIQEKPRNDGKKDRLTHHQAA